MRKAIFTVLTGNYEPLNPAPKFEGWDSILLTDKEPDDNKGWEVITVDPSSNPTILSRRLKINSHQFLLYDLVCYIDANISLRIPPPKITSYLKHPSRRNIKQEAERVIKLGKSDPLKIKKQIKTYQKKGFKDNYGLYQLGFFVRAHSHSLNKLHEEWFKQVEEHSQRDQLSFPYALWKTGTKIKSYTKPAFEIRRHTMLRPHKTVKPIDVDVHHITPGRSDKNFGKSVNDLIKNMPDNDWICLRDIDTIPVYHEQFFRQCEEIANKGEYDMVGCMTNRIGLNWQLHLGQLSGNMDILDHRTIGIERFEKYGSEVEPLNNNYIAGLFMLFPKSTWKKIGGFPEGHIRLKGKFVDWIVCDKVRKAKMKIGIAKGIYLFHMYRLWKENARDIQHLV